MTESNQMLDSYVSRLENLNERAKEVSDDKKELKAEMKANGIDAAAVDALVKERAIERDAKKKAKADEVEAIVAVYREQLSPPL